MSQHIYLSIGLDITFGAFSILSFCLSLILFFITKRTKQFIYENAIFETMETEGIKEITDLRAIVENITKDEFTGDDATSMIIPIISGLNYYNQVMTFFQRRHNRVLLRYCRASKFKKKKILYQIGIIIGILESILKRKKLINDKKVGILNGKN